MSCGEDEIGGGGKGLPPIPQSNIPAIYLLELLIENALLTFHTDLHHGAEGSLSKSSLP